MGHVILEITRRSAPQLNVYLLFLLYPFQNVRKSSQHSMMQKGRLDLVSKYQRLERLEDDPRHVPEDQPLLGPPSTHSNTNPQHGLAIITCTASVLFIASAVNSLVTLNITQFSSEFGLNPGVELW